jgi:hypothetical protein
VTGVWKMGITGLGVQIMVNDGGVDCYALPGL